MRFTSNINRHTKLVIFIYMLVIYNIFLKIYDIYFIIYPLRKYKLINIECYKSKLVKSHLI